VPRIAERCLGILKSRTNRVELLELRWALGMLLIALGRLLSGAPREGLARSVQVPEWPPEPQARPAPAERVTPSAPPPPPQCGEPWAVWM
jgi:hypothetical protein